MFILYLACFFVVYVYILDLTYCCNKGNFTTWDSDLWFRLIVLHREEKRTGSRTKCKKCKHATLLMWRYQISKRSWEANKLGRGKPLLCLVGLQPVHDPSLFYLTDTWKKLFFSVHFGWVCKSFQIHLHLYLVQNEDRKFRVWVSLQCGYHGQRIFLLPIQTVKLDSDNN